MVESTAKLRSEIMALSGVDIMLDKDNFKSTYQIMDELSQKWKDLSDIQQATIIELMAGKHQGNVFASLMTNFDTARKALDYSLNSSGSAMKEHEKWQQSLEAQINKLKASWQGLSQAFMKSDFLHGALDFIIKLVDGITLLIDKVGILPTLFTGFTIFKSFGNKGLFRTFNNDLDGFINKIGIANKSFAELMNVFNLGKTSGFKGFIKGLSAVGNSLSQTITKADLSNIQAYNNLLDQGVTSQTAWYRTMQTSSDAAKNLVESANGSKVALNGMKVASVGAKVAMVGAKVAAVALNAALTMGISLLMDFAISGIMKLVNAKKDLAEKVDEVTSKFQQQHTELQRLKGDFDTTDADSMISKYGRLSKGVNELGENVSLTSSEYSEYQSIVDTIANRFPSLVTGFNSQGGAILECAGNVEKLREEYKKLILAENEAVLDTGSDIFKDFKNDIKDTSIHDKRLEIEYGTDGSEISRQWVDYYNTNHLKDLKRLMGLGGKNLDEEIGKLLPDDIKRISNLLDEYGVKRDKFGSGDIGWESYKEHVFRVLKEDASQMQHILTDASADLNEYAEDLGSATQAYFSTAFLGGNGDIGDYSHFSERMQNIINQVTSGFGSEFYAQFINEENPYESLTKYYDNMLKAFDNLGDDGIKEFEAAFNLKTQFNNGEISYGEYIQGIKNAEELIGKTELDQEIQSQIKLTLDVEEIQSKYDALKNRLTSEEYNIQMAPEEAENFLNSLTSSEYQVAIDLIDDKNVDFSDFDSIKELRAYIEEEAKLNEAISFNVDLKLETKQLEDLNAAITQSLSGSGLGIDSEGNSVVSAVESMFAGLDSYDPSKLFERTANGIRLNSDELRRLNDEYKQTNIKGLNDKMSALGDKYNKTREELSNLTYGTDEYNQKARELSDIEAQINATETLASQYEGLASAYNTWQMAESAGSQRDMYESMLQGLENVDDEISRGWLDDGTIEFLRLIKGENLSATATTKELKKAYESLDDTIKHTTYSVRDFFTVDEDGNSTNDGVYNFLDAIGQMEEEKFGGKDVVKRDKKGNIIGFDFQVAGGDKAIADALGISEELVQIMVRAADDAGFVVSMDGTYQQLDVLKEKAQDAANKLKEIGATKFQFDLNTGDEGSVLEQYGEALKIWDTFKKNKNADGTVNMDVKGAQDAFTLVSTLQTMVDRLGEPVYMKLDATQVEKDMKTPLSKLQEYERLVQTENQLKLKGTDTSEIDKAQEEIINYFEGLSPEIKAQLGIDKLTKEELQQKIEAGEIEIPATIDLQVEMNNSLRDMVNIALYNAGLIDGEELEKRIDISLYAGEVDTTDVDTEIDRIVDESELDADKKVTIKAFAEVFGVEDIDDLSKKLEVLDDEQIQVLATVLGKVDVDKLKTTIDGLDDKTVQAIAKALGEGDVEGLKTTINGLDDKTVQAIAQALGYSDVDQLNTAIENLDPKTVQAIAQALGIKDVDSLRGAINRLSNKNVKAVANVNGKDKVDGLKSSIDNLKGKTITIWAQIKKKASELWDKLTGGGGVDGTAHVNGTAYANGTAKSGRAFKQGDWGTKDSGVALGGEEAPELLVRNGKWHLIGERGAEFFGYRKGDIIFNASQTKEIFEKGKITHGNGRGKALVSGTAFKEGSVGNEGLGKANTGKPVKGTSSSKKKNSSSSDADKFEETLDFVEIAISRIERAIDQLDKKANSVYKTWSERNKALTNEISKVGDEIELQQSAYNRYMSQASSIGLSSSWQNKIKNGSIDISTIKDEALAEKIKDYQTW